MSTFGDQLSVERIGRLPALAQVGFAVRVARYVQPLIRKYWLNKDTSDLDILDHALESAEAFAAGSSGCDLGAINEDALKQLHAISDSARNWAMSYIGKCAWWACWSVFYAIYTAAAYIKGFRGAKLAACAGSSFDNAATIGFHTEFILRDFDCVLSAAHSEHWGDHTTLSPHFFSLYSQFEDAVLEGGRSIFDVSSTVDERLMEYFRAEPARLHSISPRHFEELIASLFDAFGFNVELTRRTRDGGRDIVAVSHRVIRAKFLIECKHYGENSKVGIVPVRSLHGVVADEGATKGILVTTASGFTKSAREHLDRNKWLLEGRDFDGVVEWLAMYQRFRVESAIL